MRWAAIIAASVCAACGQSAPNPYPESAKARFEQSCPPASAVCACTWERITRTLTFEDYEAALARMRTEGLMDPRVTQARVWCLERHPS
jgi:hypothetical protein